MNAIKTAIEIFFKNHEIIRIGSHQSIVFSKYLIIGILHKSKTYRNMFYLHAPEIFYSKTSETKKAY